jgi:hypothetical protein
MAGLSAHGAERLWFAGSGTAALAFPFVVVRRLQRPGSSATSLSLAHDGTVTLHLRGGDVPLPPDRLARVVTGAVTTSTRGGEEQPEGRRVRGRPR